MMNTFSKYYKNFQDFMSLIVKTNPDYIVPVEKKGCKLLRYNRNEELDCIIRYKQFFDNTDVQLIGKRVAIIDDATKFTSTLAKYREYFESRGAIVDTYSFVGQERLYLATREKYDELAYIYQYLDESTYQEYIIQQSQALASEDVFFDIDHFVVRFSLPRKEYDLLKLRLMQLGNVVHTNDVYTPNNLEKLSFYNFDFFQDVPFILHQYVAQGELKKIRLSYNFDKEEIIIAPLAFPVWHINLDNMSDLFSNVPFYVPYDISPAIKDSGIYLNLCYIYHLSLLKAFLQATNFTNLDIAIIDKDLSAYVGPEKLQCLVNSAKNFFRQDNYDFHNINCCSNITEPIINKMRKFDSVMSVLDELRNVYDSLIVDTVIDKNYFLSYKEIVECYEGRSNIIKWIDILCDRGVLVARNWKDETNQIYYRAYRSGEGDYNHIETKTGILIPMAIGICGESYGDFARIKATFLNKILANLAYDYPCSKYDFHGIFTKPYFFGPLTYVHNDLNNEADIPLYRTEEISKYYVHDDIKKEFVANLGKEYENKLEDFFSQNNAVPESDISIYFSTLKEIYKFFGKADVLNELAICRDENVYYRHIHYDLSEALNHIRMANNCFVTNKVERCEKYLREAGKLVNAAETKLGYDINETLNKLDAEFGHKIEFKSAYRRIRNSFVEFSSDFNKNIKSKIVAILLFEKIVLNLYLYQITSDIVYLRKFYNTLIHPSFNLEIPISATEIGTIKDAVDSNKQNDVYYIIENISKRLYAMLFESFHKLLHQPQQTDYELKNKQDNDETAINLAMQYIKHNQSDIVVILHIDYQGYRNYDNVENIDIGAYFQHYANAQAYRSNGKMFSGLTGGSKNGSFIFCNCRDALRFAEDLNARFKSQHEVNQVTLRMGLSYINVNKNDIYNSIRECWNAAILNADNSVNNHTIVFAAVNKHRMKINDEKFIEQYFKVHNIDEMDSIKSISVYEFSDTIDYKTISHKEFIDDRECYGIVTVLPEECAAMRKMMSNVECHTFPGSGSGHEFWIGEIKSLNNKVHSVVLAQTLGAGNQGATYRAAILTAHFPKVKTIIMTGIAAGVPDLNNITKHVRLGDVIVSEKLIEFDNGKLINGELLQSNSAQRPSALFKQAYRKIEQLTMDGTNVWYTYIDQYANTEFKKPHRDIVYDENNVKARHPRDKSRKGYPKVFSGAIATSNKLLRDAKFRDSLKSDHGIYAIEMEASGIADASWESEKSFFIVRASSDYGDINKNDEWHFYAALVAAAFTRAILENISTEN